MVNSDCQLSLNCLLMLIRLLIRLLSRLLVFLALSFLSFVIRLLPYLLVFLFFLFSSLFSLPFLLAYVYTPSLVIYSGPAYHFLPNWYKFDPIRCCFRPCFVFLSPVAAVAPVNLDTT